MACDFDTASVHADRAHAHYVAGGWLVFGRAN